MCDDIADICILIAQVEPAFEDGFEIGEIEDPASRIPDKMLSHRVLIGGQVAFDEFDNGFIVFRVDGNGDGTSLGKGKAEKIFAIRLQHLPLDHGGFRILLEITGIFVAGLRQGVAGS